MTSPTAIPSPRPPLDATFRSMFTLSMPGLTPAQRERVALDTGRGLMTSMTPAAVALFLQYAHPWVQTGETA